MKSFIVFLFLFLPFFTTLHAACVAPTDLDEYTVIDGNHTMQGVSAFNKLYIKGNLTIKKGTVIAFSSFYVTGKVNIKKETTILANIYSEGNITVHPQALWIGDDLCPNLTPKGNTNDINCSVSGPTATPSGSNVCNLDGVDLSEYIVIDEDPWVLEAGSIWDKSYYVKGSVILTQGKNNDETQIQNNLYATGDITMNNHTIINGFAYTEGGVTYQNNGGQNDVIIGGTCECATPIPDPSARVCEIPGWEGYPVHNGNLIISGASVIQRYVTGTVTLEADAVFSGQIYAEGDILQKAGSVSSGYLHTEGALIMEDGSVNVGFKCPTPIEPPGGNEFVISTQPTALTCEPHLVTLQVLDSNGDPDTDYEGTVNLKVTAPIGNWSMITDNTRLDNGSADDGAATYEFKSTDGGTVDLALAVTEVIEVSIDMSKGALAATPATVDFQSSMIKVEKCSVLASTIAECPNVDNDPVTANRLFSLKLTAFKADETQTCINYDPNNIDFWFEYKSPNSAALAVDIEGTPIGIVSDPAVALPITFSDGIAIVSANYPDAGKIKINLKDTDISDINGAIEVIVNPYKLVIDEITETERGMQAGRVKGPGFIRASVPDYDNLTDGTLKVDTFDLTAKAIIDCTSSGESKNCTSLDSNGNKAAESFHNEITLLASNVGDYVLGTLYYKDSLQVDLMDGKFTYQDLAYSEVGNLGLQLQSNNYLLAGNNIPMETIQEVGYFYPDYLTWESYNLEASCNGFTYLSEKNAKFNYFLSAYNQAASPFVTQNYDPVRGYSVAPTANFKNYAFAGTTELTSRLLLDDYYDATNWILGKYTVDPQNVGIERITNTPDGPYLVNDNAAEYWVELVGDDGEKIDAPSNCSGDRCLLGDLGDLVYGRLQAGNGHGSEYQAITTLVEATYFDGVKFVPFERDSNCTTVLPEQLGKKTIDGTENDITGLTNITRANNQLDQGKTYFNFSAPDVRGKLNYMIRLQELSGGSAYAPWLLDSGNAVTCHDETGPLTDCISGYVEFGLFRGNDRIIYRMQTFE